MAQTGQSHRGVKAAIGAVVLAALVAAAAYVSVPREKAPVTRDAVEGAVKGALGAGELISVKFDGLEYNGQGAARIVAIDFVSGQSSRDSLLESMKAAGDAVRSMVDVSQKVVVTAHRSAFEFEEGLPYAARAAWLAPELVQPLDGWMVVRLPDEPHAPENALDGIYSRPMISCDKIGVISARIDLAAERLARPAADMMEILAAPFIDTFDYDNVFARSPGLRSLEVVLADGDRRIARVSMTRDARAAAGVAALRAALSRAVLSVSQRETAYAEKYDESGLFTPLLFDAVVAPEDKAALAALEAERRAAEERFYRALFAGGTFEVASAL